MRKSNENQITIRVWDLPLRIFHWALAVLVGVMFISAELDNFEIHILAGQGIVILMAVRIVWGIIGSSNARFSSWFFAPGEYVNYLKSLPKKEPSYSLSHSPIGSLAVIAIMIAVIVQVSTGLVSSDVDGLVEGPFAYYVSYEISRWAGDVHVQHERWLLALIIVHIAANAFYFFYKKDNLVRPMITGSKQVPMQKAPAPPVLAPNWKGLAAAVVVAAAVLWLFYQYG